MIPKSGGRFFGKDHAQSIDSARFPAKSCPPGASPMDDTMPILLVPRLVSSPRIFAPGGPARWRLGPVKGPNHIRDGSIGAIAGRILAEGSPRFALDGHSMGG